MQVEVKWYWSQIFGSKKIQKDTTHITKHLRNHEQVLVLQSIQLIVNLPLFDGSLVLTCSEEILHLLIQNKSTITSINILTSKTS